jgi:hypothetical protein
MKHIARSNAAGDAGAHNVKAAPAAAQRVVLGSARLGAISWRKPEQSA